MSVFAVALLVWLLPTMVFVAAAAVALPRAIVTRATRRVGRHPAIVRGRAPGTAANPEVEHAAAAG